MAKMDKVIQEHSIEIEMEMGFARVLCNDVPEEYVRTLNISNVIAFH